MTARPPLTPPLAPGAALTDRQVAAYIAERCAELPELAKRPRFRTMSCLLDVARREAEKMAKELPD